MVDLTFENSDASENEVLFGCVGGSSGFVEVEKVHRKARRSVMRQPGGGLPPPTDRENTAFPTVRALSHRPVGAVNTYLQIKHTCLQTCLPSNVPTFKQAQSPLAKVVLSISSIQALAAKNLNWTAAQVETLGQPVGWVHSGSEMVPKRTRWPTPRSACTVAVCRNRQALVDHGPMRSHPQA